MVQQLAQEEGEARYVPFLERYYKEQIDQAQQQAEQAQQQATQAQQQATQAQLQLEQGLRDGIATVLEVRFGDAGATLQPEIAAIHDPATLRAIMTQLKTAQTLADVRAIYQPPD